jgi:hypothetical protein
MGLLLIMVLMFQLFVVGSVSIGLLGISFFVVKFAKSWIGWTSYSMLTLAVPLGIWWQWEILSPRDTPEFYRNPISTMLTTMLIGAWIIGSLFGWTRRPQQKTNIAQSQQVE